MYFEYDLVGKKHYQTLISWLNKPHVQAYFHGQGLESTLADLKAQVEHSNSFHAHWIAFQKKEPFAHLMTSLIDPKEERFFKWMKGSYAITLDLLIGNEAYLNKGLASILIQDFLVRKFFDVDEVFIDPEVENTKAIHVYEKVGFKKCEQFIAEWHPVPHWLMKVQMQDLKQPLPLS